MTAYVQPSLHVELVSLTKLLKKKKKEKKERKKARKKERKLKEEMPGIKLTKKQVMMKH